MLVLTYNEEANVEACLHSIPWRSDVHVLDSGSVDRTAQIAESLGARVTVRPFDGYASQRNAGLALPFKHDWILMLDADERMTAELVLEIESSIAHADHDLAMMRVRRRDMFLGRWLKRSSGYPTWFPRLLRRGRVTVEREVNEIYVATGGVLHLRAHIEHYPFSKGLDWWFERHNRYSTGEAAILSADRLRPSGRLRIFFGDPVGRRASLKWIAYRLPFRPFLVFLYLFIFRGGWMDGRPGYIFAMMRMAYEVMIDAKIAADASMRNKGAP